VFLFSYFANYQSIITYCSACCHEALLYKDGSIQVAMLEGGVGCVLWELARETERMWVGVEKIGFTKGTFRPSWRLFYHRPSSVVGSLCHF